jgi:hypothetical protein
VLHGLIPLISSAETGRLGIAGLPRTWLTLLAGSAGALAEGYRFGRGRPYETLVTTLGLDGAAFAAYIEAEAPDYQACEVWTAGHARVTSGPAIQAFNGNVTKAAVQEQHDDWAYVHEQIIAPDAPGSRMVPAISSSIAGPLGVQHLPRLWLKHLLYGEGRLPEGYNHGLGFLDKAVADNLGFDRDVFADYIMTERPDYPTAEAWVRKHATTLTPQAIETINATMHIKMPPAMLLERHAELGITDPTFDQGIPLNDLDDWAALHRQLSLTARL